MGRGFRVHHVQLMEDAAQAVQLLGSKFLRIRLLQTLYQSFRGFHRVNSWCGWMLLEADDAETTRRSIMLGGGVWILIDFLLERNL